MPQVLEVVAALLIRQGRVFAAQRGAQQSYAGAWEFPGGKVEAQELAEEALRRELYEELGIDCQVGAFLSAVDLPHGEHRLRLSLYRVYLEEGEPCALEHQALGWFLPAELKDLHWTEGDRLLLERLPLSVFEQPSVFAATAAELDRYSARASGQTLFSALQRPWTYEKGQPKLGRSAQKLLESRYDMRPLKLAKAVLSDDGARRLLFQLRDGAFIETVHMPRDVREARVTLCLSSQQGCAMGCAFCATAGLGLSRNLTAGEIVGQVHAAMQAYGPERGHAVNLVFMGMGEPLMNLKAVLEAIEIMAEPSGLNISPVRMTLSTCGLLSEFPKLAQARQRPNLAISLNAVNDKLRSELMPINRKFPLAALKEALLAWPYRKREKLLLEYVLLGGVNDSTEDAAALIDFAQDLPHNINLIPYNSNPCLPFKRPSPERIQNFSAQLQAAGCFVTQRVARAASVGAACGQLVAEQRKDQT